MYRIMGQIIRELGDLKASVLALFFIALCGCDITPEYPVLDGNDGRSSLEYEPPMEPENNLEPSGPETQIKSTQPVEQNKPGGEHE